MLRRSIDLSYQPFRFTALVDDCRVQIPYRIHFSSRPDLSDLPDTAKLVGACLVSRSTDGYLRQSALRSMLPQVTSWNAPFVVALVGEYIVEILDDISQALPKMDAAPLGKFLRRNPELLRLICARVPSYWDAYYRHEFQRSAYPGFKILEAFSELTDTAP